MFEDLRSPKAKAKDERERKVREAKMREHRDILYADRANGGAWRRIEEMPFEAYAEGWNTIGTVIVTDGTDVAVASVSTRVGRPIKVIEQPTHAMTDDGIVMVGGKYEEYDRPEWWFDWKFTDELSTESEMWGKDEIGFVPTHYMPLPLPPR